MKKSDLFEGAEFGTPFKAKNGKKVFFLHRLDDGSVSCLVGDKNSYGFSILEEDEIDSRWEEPIDEAKLRNTAKSESEVYGLTFADVSISVSSNREGGFYDGFTAGYRKAKEDGRI